MSTLSMLVRWLAALAILCGLMALTAPITPAHAQEPTPENDANCVACHEHQYYLYDSGKWFCLCDAPMHCVYCHGGRTDSPVEEVAHEGLVLYPTRGHAERCQACHKEDYMSRVVAFSEEAGVSSSPVPVITATPVAFAAVSGGPPPVSRFLNYQQFETWQLIGLGVIGVFIIGFTIFGIRCYQQDCLFKERHS